VAKGAMVTRTEYWVGCSYGQGSVISKQWAAQGGRFLVKDIVNRQLANSIW